MEEIVQTEPLTGRDGDTGAPLDENSPSADASFTETAEKNDPSAQSEAESTASDYDTEGIESEGSSENSPTSEKNGDAVDYARLAEEDLKSLKLEFPELSEAKSLLDLDNPLRYAQLRDLGLSSREAFLATRAPKRRSDNRQHLSKSVPGGAAQVRGVMTDGELSSARELFSGVSDSEIRRLYKRVTQ